MQSSTAIAIRALVMLIVLISVPLFAIFGKNLPEVIKGLLDGRSLVLTPSSGQNTAGNTAAPSNPFAQSVPYRATPDSGGSSAAAGGENSADVRSSRAGAGPLATQPASFQAPSEAAPIGQDAFANRDLKVGPAPASVNSANGRMEPAQPRFGNTMDTSLSPSDRQWGTPATTRPNEMAAAPVVLPNATTNAGDEKFHRAEARLRELGATYYMLESWGADNSQYRFVCKMAMNGNPGMNQFFQATKNDAWGAMEDVLAQVEQWRTQPPR
jgi:hypothetical protein